MNYNHLQLIRDVKTYTKGIIIEVSHSWECCDTVILNNLNIQMCRWRQQFWFSFRVDSREQDEHEFNVGNSMTDVW